MLVQLGARGGDQHVVDLLVDCHGRIRSFLALAERLARAEGVPADECRETAQRVHRYFTEAFPLHVADEDELVTRHLSGHSPAIDRALATMQTEHVDHAPRVAALIDACTATMRDRTPHRSLLDAALAASAVLEPHLALEEREIFPVLRTLTQPACDEIRAAMRARRDSAKR